MKLKSVCLLILFISFASSVAYAQRPSRISFQAFYDELEPYGRWYNDPDYGYIWAPDAGRDFRPYVSEGHWVLTEYGNTWVSDYSWGWAPFHYGRWEFNSYYGWFWVPDYEWGPGWVSWRWANGYYGWAPMGYRVQISYIHWIFVPQRYIVNPRFYSYCVSGRYASRIYRRSRRIDNYYDRVNRRYVYGPRRYEIERATRSRVEVYRINDMDRPGRPEVARGTVKIYRPEMDKVDRNTARPSRITDRSRPESRINEGSDRTERNSGENSSSTRPERPSRGNESSGDRVRQESERTETNPPASNRPERSSESGERVEDRGRRSEEVRDRNTSTDQNRKVEREPQRTERSSERPNRERSETNSRSQERREAQPQKQESSGRSSNGSGRPERSR